MIPVFFWAGVIQLFNDFLQALTADDADALIIPGGFGAAKNLCNFAHQGVETADLKANEDVAAAINSFKGKFFKKRW